MKKLMVLLAAALLSSAVFAQQKEWGVYTDADGNGGSSTATVTVENDVTKVTGTVTTKYQYGFAGITLIGDKDAFIEELKNAKGIKLTVKGDGKDYNVRIETSDRSDYCFHEYTFKATEKETTYEIPFKKLVQESWGKQKKFDVKKITTVSIQTIGQPIDSYSLEVVKLEILK